MGCEAGSPRSISCLHVLFTLKAVDGLAVALNFG